MFCRQFSIALFAGLLGGAAALHAQQAQSAVPGQPVPPEVKQFQGYEDQWSLAEVKGDQYAMENLFSPLFVTISSTGDVNTRNQQIANLLEKAERPVSMEQRAVSVRMFGDTAVVNGTYVMKWDNDGKRREERGIFTHVYAQDHGRWRCVNSQRTAVVNMTPALTAKNAKKKQTRAKSDASEPFHIPLFYKGKKSADPGAQQDASIPPN